MSKTRLLVFALLCVLYQEVSDAWDDQANTEKAAKITYKFSTMATNIKDLANLTGEALKTTANVVMKLQKFGAWLGPAGAIVSSVLEIAALFIPKPDSQELQAIKQGFKEMHLRFDKIEEQLGNLAGLVQASAAAVVYETRRTPLLRYEVYLDKIKEDPSSNSLASFITQCKTHNQEPWMVLEEMHESIMSRTILQPLLKGIREIAGENIQEFNRMTIFLMRNAVKIAWFAEACWGAMKTSDKDKKYHKDRINKQIKEIQQALIDEHHSYFVDMVDKLVTAAKDSNYEMSAGHTGFAEQLEEQLAAKWKFKKWVVASSHRTGFTSYGKRDLKIFYTYGGQYGSSLMQLRTDSTTPSWGWMYGGDWVIFVAWCHDEIGNLGDKNMNKVLLDQAHFEFNSLDAECVKYLKTQYLDGNDKPKRNLFNATILYDFYNKNMPTFMDATAKIVVWLPVWITNVPDEKGRTIKVLDEYATMARAHFGVSNIYSEHKLPATSVCGKWFTRYKCMQIAKTKVYLAFNFKD